MTIIGAHILLGSTVASAGNDAQKLPENDKSPIRASRRTALAFLLNAFFPLLCGPALPRQRRPVRAKHLTWVVYYGQTADEDLLASYDIVVLDPGFQGSLERVKAKGAQTYGYVSLGEVRTTSPTYKLVNPAVVLEANLEWPDVQRVDVRSPAWQKYILEVAIPPIVNAGFQGLMLDTLDTPVWLEQVDSQRFRGMRQAAVDLVATIRTRHPALKLIMNRGYAILPDVVDYIDAIIAESLLTMPDADKTGILTVSQSQVCAQLALLASARNRSRPLPILSLDYSVLDDRAAIRDLYRRELLLGHHPYVTTPLIDHIIAHPKHDATPAARL
jgi:polysaccharide biosynthesis protein PelA